MDAESTTQARSFPTKVCPESEISFEVLKFGVRVRWFGPCSGLSSLYYALNSFLNKWFWCGGKTRKKSWTWSIADRFERLRFSQVYWCPSVGHWQKGKKSKNGKMITFALVVFDWRMKSEICALNWMGGYFPKDFMDRVAIMDAFFLLE